MHQYIKPLKCRDWRWRWSTELDSNTGSDQIENDEPDQCQVSAVWFGAVNSLNGSQGNTPFPSRVSSWRSNSQETWTTESKLYFQRKGIYLEHRFVIKLKQLTDQVSEVIDYFWSIECQVCLQGTISMSNLLTHRIIRDKSYSVNLCVHSGCTNTDTGIGDRSDTMLICSF